MNARDKIESLLPEYIRLTDEMKQAEDRKYARTALLQQELREVSRSFEESITQLDKQRKEIRDRILALWNRHFNKETTITFPLAKVSRRNYRELTIHDKIALLNALDRIGRLDLVDYSFRENEIAKLYDAGGLKGISPNTVNITDHYNLQVRIKKE